MRVALASCSNLPGWEVDDAPFHRALGALGLDYAVLPWDDPSVDWSLFDGCLIRTTWDYMERRSEFVAWARDIGCQVPLFNPSEVISWNSHKSYLRDLESLGVAIAPSEWCAKGQVVDIEEVMARRGWQKGFIKPQVGATARETLRFDLSKAGLASAQSHLDRLLPVESLIIQPYLGRVEKEGERSLIFFDGEVSHVVEKRPVTGDYRVQDDFGASDFPVKPRGDEVELALRALRAMGQRLGLTESLLYARVDILRTDAGQPVLNELEAVEPSLFFRHEPTAGGALAQALAARLNQ